MENRPHETPSDVDAEDGQVIVDGPDGLALSFTPEAADATSQRLRDGAVKAKGQQPDVDPDRPDPDIF